MIQMCSICYTRHALSAAMWLVFGNDDFDAVHGQAMSCILYLGLAQLGLISCL